MDVALTKLIWKNSIRYGLSVQNEGMIRSRGLEILASLLCLRLSSGCFRVLSTLREEGLRVAEHLPIGSPVSTVKACPVALLKMNV